MLAEPSSEQHAAGTAQPNVPRHGRRSRGDRLVDVARRRHERRRAPDARATATPRGRQWLTMALAFACGLLLAVTIALLRKAPGVTPAPKRSESAKQIALRSPAASAAPVAAHRDPPLARLAPARVVTARSGEGGAGAGSAAGRSEPSAQVDAARTEPPASTPAPPSEPPAAPAPEAPVANAPAAQASAACEAPGDLGC